MTSLGKGKRASWVVSRFDIGRLKSSLIFLIMQNLIESDGGGDLKMTDVRQLFEAVDGWVKGDMVEILNMEIAGPGPGLRPVDATPDLSREVRDAIVEEETQTMSEAGRSRRDMWETGS